MNPVKLRLVVAEDERDSREFLQEALTRLGHDVVGVAANGKELAEQVAATHPDLVLTDIKMPGSDGIDVALELNRERDVPVILVSAHHDTATLARIGAGHLVGYLVKPISEADLKAALAMGVARWQHAQALKKETADVRQALEDRKIVEKAKGVIMKRGSVDEEEAYRRLRKLASNQNQKLIDVGKKVIASEEIFHELERL